MKSLLVVIFLTVSACDQAPNDDPRATPSAQNAEGSRVRVRPDRTSPAKHAKVEKSYELQGATGQPRVFPSFEKCEAARGALASAQAKEDGELSKNGPLRVSPPVLVCFPV